MSTEFLYGQYSQQGGYDCYSTTHNDHCDLHSDAHMDSGSRDEHSDHHQDRCNS